MHGDPEEPAFAGGRDVVQDERRRRQHLAALEDADPAGPLGDEHPPVGREGHRPRDLEVLGDDLDGEARAVARGHDIAWRRRRRIGRRRIVAGGAGGDDDERERENLRPGCAHGNLLAASGADGVRFSLLRM